MRRRMLWRLRLLLPAHIFDEPVIIGVQGRKRGEKKMTRERDIEDALPLSAEGEMPENTLCDSDPTSDCATDCSTGGDCQASCGCECASDE